MTIFRTLAVTLLLAAASSGAYGQIITSLDRVISGNANLSSLSKEAYRGLVKDADLRSILLSTRLNIIVIQERTQSGPGSNIEYWVVYAIGRETTFREREITKEDFGRLADLAIRLHQP